MGTKIFFFFMIFSFFFFESKGGRTKITEGDSTRFDLTYYNKSKVLSRVLLEHVFNSNPRMQNAKQFAGGKIFIQCKVEGTLRILKVHYNANGTADENIVSLNFIFEGEDLLEVYCDSSRSVSIKIFWGLEHIKDMIVIPLMNLGFTKEELILAGIDPGEEYSKEYYLLWKKEKEKKDKISKALQEEKMKKEQEKVSLSAEKMKEMREAMMVLTEKPSMPKGVFLKPTTISFNKKFSSVFEKGEITDVVEKKLLRGKYNSERGNYGTLYFPPFPFCVDFELHPEGGYSLYFFLKGDKENAIMAHPAEFVLRGENVFWLSFGGSDEDLALILTVLLEKKILKKEVVKIPSNLSENARKEWEELPRNDWDLKETRRQIELTKSLGN